MSAFVCSPDTLRLLVRGAQRYGGHGPGSGLAWYTRPPTDPDWNFDTDARELGHGYGPRAGVDPQDALVMLWRENVRSVQHRYPDTIENPDRLPGYIGDDEPCPDLPPLWRDGGPQFSHVDVLKACDCYSYQACETDDWPDTEAAQFITALRLATISKLPGYDASPWWSR